MTDGIVNVHLKRTVNDSHRKTFGSSEDPYMAHALANIIQREAKKAEKIIQDFQRKKDERDAIRLRLLDISSSAMSCISLLAKIVELETDLMNSVFRVRDGVDELVSMDNENNCLTVDERSTMMNAVNVMSMAHIFHNGTRSSREQLSSLIFSMPFAHPPITPYMRNRRESDSECSIASSISLGCDQKEVPPCATFLNEIDGSNVIPTPRDGETQEVETVKDGCLVEDECSLQPLFVGEISSTHPNAAKLSSPKSVERQICSKISLRSTVSEGEQFVVTDVKTSPVDLLISVSPPLSGLLNTLSTSPDRQIFDIDSIKEELDYPEEGTLVTEPPVRAVTAEMSPEVDTMNDRPLSHIKEVNLTREPSNLTSSTVGIADLLDSVPIMTSLQSGCPSRDERITGEMPTCPQGTIR